MEIVYQLFFYVKYKIMCSYEIVDKMENNIYGLVMSIPKHFILKTTILLDRDLIKWYTFTGKLSFLLDNINNVFPF